MNLKNTTLGKVETMTDKSVKITLYTRELPPEQLAELFINANSEILSIEIPDDPGETKSPSQRFRNTLYRVWESDEKKKEKFSTFTLYYNSVLEKLIENAKENIL